MEAVTFQVLPSLSDAEYEALKADIAQHGVLVPVEYDEHGTIIDGHHRVKACEELGIEAWPKFTRRGLSEDEKRTLARKLNLARRHLSQQGKRELIEAQLKETPEASNNSIALMLGVSDMTVRSVRQELESTSQIRKLDKTKGADGKDRPAKREPKPAPEPPAEPKPLPYSFEDESEHGRKAMAQAGKAERVRRTEERRDEVETIKAKAADLPKDKYETIVIDPPWEMEKIERDVRPNQVAFDYPTMSEAELADFDLESMAADDCHLFCWTTQKHVPSALRLLEDWGFRYILLMPWHKPGGFQPIGLPQYNCEFVVYGRKGAPKFITTKNFFCCFKAPRREHSRKPDEFYETIRRVTAGPRIDVFSREKREGFDQFGNEVEKFADA